MIAVGKKGFEIDDNQAVKVELVKKLKAIVYG